MVNAVKVEGYTIDLVFLSSQNSMEGKVFLEQGVRKATVWKCGLCYSDGYGWCDTQKEAENCCSGVKQY